MRPTEGDDTLNVRPHPAPPNFTVMLVIYKTCAAGSEVLGSQDPVTDPTQTVTVRLQHKLASHATVCVVEHYTPVTNAPPGWSHADTYSSLTVAHPPRHVDTGAYDPPCEYSFNDCDWVYSVVAGVEQSVLSAQASQTDPFIDLFVRTPANVNVGSIWLRARFLGTPVASDTNNVIATLSDPSSNIKTQTITSIGSAVDYIAGIEHDFLHASRKNSGAGQFTVGGILGFGATSTLNSSVATVAFATPAYGTSECQQLGTRFTLANGYVNPLPGSDTVTTSTTIGTAAPVVTSVPYCVVQPGTTTTSTTDGAGVKTTVVRSGTPITNIAFTPQDRSSFLLKYVAGIRLITRIRQKSSLGCSTESPDEEHQPCTRAVVDLTFGQDQAITGGRFHGTVFKSDATFPIGSSGIVFFGTAAIRLRSDILSSTLILAPTPISTGSGAAVVGAVIIPSPSVFVLPLRQPDRDFYRFGVAIDLVKIVPKLFNPASSK